MLYSTLRYLGRPSERLLEKGPNKDIVMASESLPRFQDLTMALCQPPMLHAVQSRLPFLLFRDTSDVGLGGTVGKQDPPPQMGTDQYITLAPVD